MATNLESCRLYVGTDDGVRVLRIEDGEARVAASGLEGNAVRDIAVRPDDPDTASVGCGLRGWGLHRTTDGGESFESLGFDDEWVWGVTLDPTDPETLYVGTEPPALSVSRDGGTFEAFEGIDDVPSRDEWTFFYEPFEAGHVHGLAVHPDRPERLYAGVEIGGVVYSHDGGRTWSDSLVGRDLHRLGVDPADPDRVLAAAGQGLFVSGDAARTWSSIDRFKGRYVKGIAFAPDDPERVYVSGAASAIGADARLHASDDGGATWRTLREFASTGVAGKVGLGVHPTDGDVLFHDEEVSEDRSRVRVSVDGGDDWTALAPEVPTVRTIAVADGDTVG